MVIIVGALLALISALDDKVSETERIEKTTIFYTQWASMKMMNQRRFCFKRYCGQ